MVDKTTFNKDKKFDIQLAHGINCEKEIADIFAGKKIELKSETFQWEKTGNICIEYEWDGNPSGIAATEADFWFHNLRRQDGTFCILVFPIDELKFLCRLAFKKGLHRSNGGDGGKSKVILLPLNKLLRGL